MNEILDEIDAGAEVREIVKNEREAFSALSVDKYSVNALLDKFTGSIHSAKQVNSRSEMNSYLDERYGG